MIILKKGVEEKCIYRVIKTISKDKKEISNNSIFNLDIWNTFREDIIKFENIGIFVDSDQNFDASFEDLESLKIIQINFLTFKDGRPFFIS